MEPLAYEVETPGELHLPPKSLPEAPPSAVSELSFTSLSLYRNCGLRFLAEYEIGMRGDSEELLLPGAAEDESVGGEGETPSEFAPTTRGGARILRFGPGNAVHSLLEWSARNRWQAPTPERIESALRSEGIAPTPESISSASGMVSNWLDSDLLQGLRERGERLVPEEAFLLPIGESMFRGYIDLSVLHGSGNTIELVDYKTNSLAKTSTSALMDHYDLQRKLYAVAVGEKAESVVTHYVFLKDTSPRVEELVFDRDDLDQARSEIEELASAIAEGRFEPSLKPGASLCSDCPVWRSCPHTAEAKKRSDRESEIAPGDLVRPER